MCTGGCSDGGTAEEIYTPLRTSYNRAAGVSELFEARKTLVSTISALMIMQWLVVGKIRPNIHLYIRVIRPNDVGISE